MTSSEYEIDGSDVRVPDDIEAPILRDEVLDEAKRLISGDRAGAYGDARQGFGLVGLSWAAILKAAGLWNDEYAFAGIPPEIVALMMTALKVQRAAGNPAREDSWVDGAGYLALGAEIGAHRAGGSQ